MKILAIETSCDETAVSMIEGRGNLVGKMKPKFLVLANVVLSQIPLHRKYGGVYPSLAKREHAKNLLPVMIQTLEEANILEYRKQKIENKIKDRDKKELEKIFEREPELLAQFLEVIPTLEKPKIDVLAVTYGPGLEPALWVGINFAKALALIWNIPVIPVNHMEGHAVSALLAEQKPNLDVERPSWRKIREVEYPAVLLLVSGGHTELVLIKKPLLYKLLGATRDDAAGEAFDKTARILGLPYPGGPEIAKLAREYRTAHSSRKKNAQARFSFPRPMIQTEDLDFSFSGLKTAVLYAFKKLPRKTLNIKQEAAKEIENAIAEVIVSKTKRAMKRNNAKTLILGGGVTANQTIRKNFESLAQKYDFDLLIPSMELTTDNALMIALAGYLRANESERNIKKTPAEIQKIRANGSLELTS